MLLLYMFIFQGVGLMLLISSWKVFNAISFNAMYFVFGNFHTMETWKTMEFCFF